jgi:hypothetical protein
VAGSGIALPIVAAHELPLRPAVSKRKIPGAPDAMKDPSDEMQRSLPKRTGISDNYAWDDTVSSQHCPTAESKLGNFTCQS